MHRLGLGYGRMKGGLHLEGEDGFSRVPPATWAGSSSTSGRGSAATASPLVHLA